MFSTNLFHENNNGKRTEIVISLQSTLVFVPVTWTFSMHFKYCCDKSKWNTWRLWHPFFKKKKEKTLTFNLLKNDHSQVLKFGLTAAVTTHGTLLTNPADTTSRFFDVWHWLVGLSAHKAATDSRALHEFLITHLHSVTCHCAAVLVRLQGVDTKVKVKVCVLAGRKWRWPNPNPNPYAHQP